MAGGTNHHDTRNTHNTHNGNKGNNRRQDECSLREFLPHQQEIDDKRWDDLDMEYYWQSHAGSAEDDSASRGVLADLGRTLTRKVSSRWKRAASAPTAVFDDGAREDGNHDSESESTPTPAYAVPAFVSARPSLPPLRGPPPPSLHSLPSQLSLLGPMSTPAPPSAPSTPTSLESPFNPSRPGSASGTTRGPRVLNGRLVKPRPVVQLVGSPLRDANDEDDGSKEGNGKEKGNGNKIWKLVKRISTGGLREKYHQHQHSHSFSLSPNDSPKRGSLLSSLTRSKSVAGAPVALQDGSEEKEVPPPVPALPKNLLQSPHSLMVPSPVSNLLSPVASSPASPCSVASDPGYSIYTTPKKRGKDKDKDRSASSPSPSASSPVSGTSSLSGKETTTKRRVLARISSVGMLRRKPSFAEVVVPSLPSTPMAQTMPTKRKEHKPKSMASLSCIPSIPAYNKTDVSQSIPIISSTPSTPVKSSMSSPITHMGLPPPPSRPGTRETRSSSPVSSESYSTRFFSGTGTSYTAYSKSEKSTKSRSSLDSDSAVDPGPHHNQHNQYTQHTQYNTTNTVPVPPAHPLAKHIVPPIELSQTLGDGWGVEHVLDGDGETRKGSSDTALKVSKAKPTTKPASSARTKPSLHIALNSRSTASLDCSRPDKWDSLDKWDKIQLDKLDGLKATRGKSEGGGWNVIRTPLEAEMMPSLPVPPRRRRAKEEEEWGEGGHMSASVGVAPVAESPAHGNSEGVITPALSTFGRMTGKQIGMEEQMEELQRQAFVQGRSSFSTFGADRRESRESTRSRGGAKGRRSLSALRPLASATSPTKEGCEPHNLSVPLPWVAKSHSTPPSPLMRSPAEAKQELREENEENTEAPTINSRPLGGLFRKLSFSGGSSGSSGSPAGKRNKVSPKRPSTAAKDEKDGEKEKAKERRLKTRSMSMSVMKGVIWGGGEEVRADAAPPVPQPQPQPRKLLRKNSFKRNNNDERGQMGGAPLTRPRTADGSTSPGPSEREKRARWEDLLQRSDRAGGTIHLQADDEGLLSDKLRMSLVSTVSSGSAAAGGDG